MVRRASWRRLGVMSMRGGDFASDVYVGDGLLSAA